MILSYSGSCLIQIEERADELEESSAVVAKCMESFIQLSIKDDKFCDEDLEGLNYIHESHGAFSKVIQMEEQLARESQKLSFKNWERMHCEKTSNRWFIHLFEKKLFLYIF